MANTLQISKLTGGYFEFILNSEPPIKNFRNDLFAIDNQLHFKTANGANIIKQQVITPQDVTLISGGTFTFTTVDEVFAKLTDVGYFDWFLGGGSGTGVDRFTDLIDTFPNYIGRDMQCVVVDESQLKLKTIPFYNKQFITEMNDFEGDLLANKMMVTNASGTKFVLSDLPPKPEQFLNSVGFFDYADLATQTTPISFVAGVDKKLTNDALGATTNKNYPPYGITDVWSTSTNACNFSQLSLGDAVGVRFDVTATTTASNQVVRAYIKLGIGTPSEYILNVFGQQIKTAQENQFSLFTKLYIGNEDIRTAPSEFYILSDNNGTVKVNGWYFQIERRSINVVTFEAIVPDTYKVSFIYSGSTITVPSAVKIRNVYLNKVPCDADEWSQSGNTITVTTAINGDKITLIN